MCYSELTVQCGDFVLKIVQHTAYNVCINELSRVWLCAANGTTLRIMCVFMYVRVRVRFYV